jgi:hypothetical protein
MEGIVKEAFVLSVASGEEGISGSAGGAVSRCDDMSAHPCGLSGGAASA